MNSVTPARGPSRPPNARSQPRPGQTLVEFALTLPLLLLLLFGIIELGRIFQSWVTLQNAALAAARAAITGEYDTTMFPNLDTSDFVPNSAAGPAGYSGDGVQCQFTAPGAPNYSFFQNHWGIPCDPKSDDNQGMRKDVLRLIAINRAADRKSVV